MEGSNSLDHHHRTEEDIFRHRTEREEGNSKSRRRRSSEEKEVEGMRWWLMVTVVDEKAAEEEGMIELDYTDCRRKNTLYKKQPRPLMSLSKSLTVEVQQQVKTNSITGLIPLSEINSIAEACFLSVDPIFTEARR